MRKSAAAVAAALALSVASPAQAAGHAVNDYAVASTFVVGSLSMNMPSNALQILKGDTVVWTNLDAVAHDVTFKDRSYALRKAGAQVEALSRPVLRRTSRRVPNRTPGIGCAECSPVASYGRVQNAVREPWCPENWLTREVTTI